MPGTMPGIWWVFALSQIVLWGVFLYGEFVADKHYRELVGLLKEVRLSLADIRARLSEEHVE